MGLLFLLFWYFSGAIGLYLTVKFFQFESVSMSNWNRRAIDEFSVFRKLEVWIILLSLTAGGIIGPFMLFVAFLAMAVNGNTKKLLGPFFNIFLGRFNLPTISEIMNFDVVNYFNQIALEKRLNRNRK